jgi:hypothetical protein
MKTKLKQNSLEADISTIVRGGYDLQKLRIQMGNRIVAQFKHKLGIKPGISEDDTEGNDMDAEGANILKELRTMYDKIMDGVKSFPSPSRFKGEGLIGTFAELSLMAQYRGLEVNEHEAFHRLQGALAAVPLWNKYLKDVAGVGPAMAGVIISEIDITKARYASSLWKYAGLDVAADGRGRSRRTEHQIKVDYKAKDGTIKQRNSITFNPFLKTKLVGVLGPCFIKQVDRATGDPGKYRRIYLDYKHRMANHNKYGEHNDGKKDDEGRFITSKARRHNMATRYCVKMFLADLYTAWRTMEKLPVALPFAEAKLGMEKHHDVTLDPTNQGDKELTDAITE